MNPMTPSIDETHDPRRKSWVESANAEHTDFPIQNLPFGVFKRYGAEEEPRVGVAIGDRILDVAGCRAEGLFKGSAFTAALACDVAALNAFMALGRGSRSSLRQRVFELLSADSPERTQTQPLVERWLSPMSGADLLMPVDVGDYTDFSASVFHAANVGSMFRRDSQLLSNYKHLPVAYHGRASSLVVGGTPVHRPSGQVRVDNADGPRFAPSKLLDYELEVGFFVGSGNAAGRPVAIDEVNDHIFGLCLVNDWSARDIQEWECQPLGPFLAKSFSTSISPWIVTLEALEPFRSPAFDRSHGDPDPLPHLDSPFNRDFGAYDVTLEVFVRSARMREENMESFRLSRGAFRDMYWTIAQMLAHHTSNGCNMRSGDLLASGTVSGPDGMSRGCLLELAQCGEKPVELPTGEQRRFLEDGDEVVLRGFCEREGFVRIGFGECSGVIEPAL